MINHLADTTDDDDDDAGARASALHRNKLSVLAGGGADARSLPHFQACPSP